jgi:nucleoid DNA-binding protein
VTKKEIVKQIADSLKMPQMTTKIVVQMTFQAIIDTLVKDGRIELRNFGVFVVKQRKPRRARNPKTNQPVNVEAKKVVTFQPGKIMEQKVRNAEKVIVSKRTTRKSTKAASPASPLESPVPDAVTPKAPKPKKAAAKKLPVPSTNGTIPPPMPVAQPASDGISMNIETEATVSS